MKMSRSDTIRGNSRNFKDVHNLSLNLLEMSFISQQFVRILTLIRRLEETVTIHILSALKL